MIFKIMTRIFICLLPLFLIACTITESDKIIDNFRSKNGKLEQDIPGRLSTDVYKNLQQSLEKNLGLISMKNGFDRFQIRIWEGTGDYSGNLYLIKNLPDFGWTGELGVYDYVQNHEGKLDSIFSNKKTIVKTESEWNSLINSLYKLDILTLPHWESIPGYDQLGMHENGIAIEIAGKTKYRIYSFLSPFSRQEDFDDAKKVVQIIQLVKREFK